MCIINFCFLKILVYSTPYLYFRSAERLLIVEVPLMISVFGLLAYVTPHTFTQCFTIFCLKVSFGFFQGKCRKKDCIIDIVEKYEVSRSPKVGLPISVNLGVRKSVGLPISGNLGVRLVSFEVLYQIGLVITSKPYSSISSVRSAFTFHVEPRGRCVEHSRFKSHPCTIFIILFLLKSC